MGFKDAFQKVKDITGAAVDVTETVAKKGLAGAKGAVDGAAEALHDGTGKTSVIQSALKSGGDALDAESAKQRENGTDVRCEQSAEVLRNAANELATGARSRIAGFLNRKEDKKHTP